MELGVLQSGSSYFWFPGLQGASGRRGKVLASGAAMETAFCRLLISSSVSVLVSGWCHVVVTIFACGE